MKLLLAQLAAFWHCLWGTLGRYEAHQQLDASQHATYKYFGCIRIRHKVRHTLVACTCGAVFYRNEVCEADTKLNNEVMAKWASREKA